MQHIFHDIPFFLTMAGQSRLVSIDISSPVPLPTFFLAIPHQHLYLSLSFLHLPPLICTYIESRSKLHSAVPMTMFIHRLLRPRWLVPSIIRLPPADPALSDNWAPPGDHLAALKIVHARGMVESYYMALPVPVICVSSSGGLPAAVGLRCLAGGDTRPRGEVVRRPSQDGGEALAAYWAAPC